MEETMKKPEEERQEMIPANLTLPPKPKAKEVPSKYDFQKPTSESRSPNTELEQISKLRFACIRLKQTSKPK